MDSKRSFEKYLEVGGNEMMEGFDESNLPLRLTVMFNWKNIKATYLRRHKDNLERLGAVVDSVDWGT